jgi:hypothetical protein
MPRDTRGRRGAANDLLAVAVARPARGLRNNPWRGADGAGGGAGDPSNPNAKRHQTTRAGRRGEVE